MTIPWLRLLISSPPRWRHWRCSTSIAQRLPPRAYSVWTCALVCFSPSRSGRWKSRLKLLTTRATDTTRIDQLSKARATLPSAPICLPTVRNCERIRSTETHPTFEGVQMYFKQFYLGCLAHASYLIGADGEAAVVDPQRDVDQYIEEATA